MSVTNPNLDQLDAWGTLDSLPYSLDSSVWSTATSHYASGNTSTSFSTSGSAEITFLQNPSLDELDFWGTLDSLPYSLDSSVWSTAKALYASGVTVNVAFTTSALEPEREYGLIGTTANVAFTTSGTATHVKTVNGTTSVSVTTTGGTPVKLRTMSGTTSVTFTASALQPQQVQHRVGTLAWAFTTSGTLSVEYDGTGSTSIAFTTVGSAGYITLFSGTDSSTFSSTSELTKVGARWSTISEGSETWTNISEGSETWTPISEGSESWLIQ